MVQGVGLWAFRAVGDLVAVGTVGALVALARLVPEIRSDVADRLARSAATWAWLWAAAMAVQLIGVPDRGPDRATLLVLAGAVGVALGARLARSRPVRATLAIGAAALTGPLLVADQVTVGETALLLVVAVTVWLGGLLALVVHLRGSLGLLPTAVLRFGQLAVLCDAAVAAAGLLGAWYRLGPAPGAWLSASGGGLVLLAATSLALLGGLGRWHRRRVLPALRRGGDTARRAFARFAGVELGVLGLSVGVAVLLAYDAPATATSGREPVLGPPTPLSAIGATHPDALVLVGLVVAGGLLVRWAGLRRRSGRRVVLLVAAVLVAVWSLAGGLAAYSTSLYSAQVAQVLVLALVVPPLLVRGLPLVRLADVDELIRQPLVRVAAHPVIAVVALAGVLVLVLHSPLLTMSLRHPAGHVVLGLLALAAGLVVFVPMAVTAGRESTYRAGLLAVAALLSWYAVQAGSAGFVAAGGWYRDLDLSWLDPVHDQRRAAALLAMAAGTLAGLEAWRVATGLVDRRRGGLDRI